MKLKLLFVDWFHLLKQSNTFWFSDLIITFSTCTITFSAKTQHYHHLPEDALKQWATGTRIMHQHICRTMWLNMHQLQHSKISNILSNILILQIAKAVWMKEIYKKTKSTYPCRAPTPTATSFHCKTNKMSLIYLCLNTT